MQSSLKSIPRAAPPQKLPAAHFCPCGYPRHPGIDKAFCCDTLTTRCNNFHRRSPDMIRKLFLPLIAAASFAAASLAPAQDAVPSADFVPASEFVQPPCHTRYTFAMNVFYGFNAAPDSTFSSDMAGLELGGAYYITPKQALTLSFSVAADTQTCDCFDDHCYPLDDPFDRVDISLLAGYRFTQPIGRRLSLSLGVAGGLDIQRLDIDCYYRDRHGWFNEYQASGTRCGFGYAGYAELGFLLTPRARFTIGYQYHGATTKPEAKDHLFGDHYSAEDMRWHEVRLGVDFCF